MDNKEFINAIYKKYELNTKEKNAFYNLHVYKAESRLILKTVATFTLAFLLLACILYAGVTATRYFKNLSLNPSFTSNLGQSDMNDVWIGTFQLVWNDAMDEITHGPIQFEDGESQMANELNKRSFTADMLSDDSYYKISGATTPKLKEDIKEALQLKFNETSRILDLFPWENDNGYILYAMLKKEFHFLVPFSEQRYEKFGDSEEYVRYFGADVATGEESFKNIEILFYNSDTEFAVRLLTKEGEDVLLYRTDNNSLSFEDAYNEMLDKEKMYTGNKNFIDGDFLRVPYIQFSKEINYDELCGRIIKGTSLYISQAIQTIDFELNNTGGSVKSEAGMMFMCASDQPPRYFKFNDDFYLFLKETDKEKPYMALRVDDTDILETTENRWGEEITSNKTEDVTITNSQINTTL